LLAAVDDAGWGISGAAGSALEGDKLIERAKAKMAGKHVPLMFKQLPAIIALIQTRSTAVKSNWETAQHQMPASILGPDRAADGAQWEHRSKTLAAAQREFADIGGDQSVSAFLREGSKLTESQRFRAGCVTLASVLAITVVVSMGASAVGQWAAEGVVDFLASDAAGGASLLARSAGMTVDVGINTVINTGAQAVTTGDASHLARDGFQNLLVEVMSRGLAKLSTEIKKARAIEQTLMRTEITEASAGLNAAQRAEAGVDAAVGSASQMSRMSSLGKAVDYVGDLTMHTVTGGAMQYLSHHATMAMLGKAKHGKVGPDGKPEADTAAIDEDIAGLLMQQGAAIALGKFFHGKLPSWHAERAAIENNRTIGQLPEARALINSRNQFFGEAEALGKSGSPDPNASIALLARYEQVAQFDRIFRHRVAEVEHTANVAAALRAQKNAAKQGAKNDGHGAAPSHQAGDSVVNASKNGPAADIDGATHPTESKSTTAAEETAAPQTAARAVEAAAEGSAVNKISEHEGNAADVMTEVGAKKTGATSYPSAIGTGSATTGWKPAAQHQGLGRGRAIRGYQRELGQMESKWSAMAVSQRTQHLTDVINGSLRRVGVHEVTVQSAALSEGTHGKFIFQEWQVQINETVLHSPTLTAKQFQDLANTLYHEARHAEQWFHIAGYLALQGLDATGIEQLTYMKPNPVLAAMRNARKMSKQQIADAKAYTENIYGEKSGYRNATLEASENEQQTQKQLEIDIQTKPLTQAELLAKGKELYDSEQRSTSLYEAYLGFPEEVDAHAVGNRTGVANRSRTARIIDYAGNLIGVAKKWLASYRSAGTAASHGDLVKAHGYLCDAIVRIQQHLGTLGSTPFEISEAAWLSGSLSNLITVQQSYRAQLSVKGIVP
jgi:hypothetical protein